MSKLFEPTYKASSLSVDNVGTQGIQQFANAFANIKEEQLKREALAKEQARWNITNARAEEAAQQKRDLLKREADKSAFLKGYDPRIGLHTGNVAEGLRGIGSTQTKAMSDKAGSEIQAILGRYGATGPKGISNLSQDDKNKLGQELGNKALASVAQLSPTQERVNALVQSDVMRNTGDALAADRLAKLYGGKYDTADTIQKAEAAKVKATNEEIERRKRDLNRSLNLQSKLSSRGRVKADKVKSFDEIVKYIGDANVGSYDANQALDASKLAEKYGISLSRIKQGLEKLKDPKRFGLSDILNDREFQGMEDDPAKFIKYLEANTTDVGKDGTRGLTDTEIRILNAPTVKASSLEDILANRGERAAIRGFGINDTNPIPTVVPPVVTRQTTKERPPVSKKVLAPKVDSTLPKTEAKPVKSEVVVPKVKDIPTYKTSKVTPSLGDTLGSQGVKYDSNNFVSRLFPGKVPVKENNEVAAVARKDYETFLAKKRANPGMDEQNVEESRLHNRYLNSKNLTDEELKGTTNFPIREYKGLDDNPLENVAPVLGALGVTKGAKELYSGGRSLLNLVKGKTSPDAKLLTAKNPNVISEEKRIADRLAQIGKRRAERKLINSNPKAGKSSSDVTLRPVRNSEALSSPEVSSSAKKIGEQLRNQERANEGLRTVRQSTASRASRKSVSVEEKVKEAQRKFDASKANKPTKSREEIINNLQNWEKARSGINPLLQDNPISFLK